MQLYRTMLVLVLLSTLAGCAQRSTTFPAGTYTKTITEADVSGPAQFTRIGGEWSKVFQADGTYREYYKGEEVVRGTYTTSGNQITTIDESGLFAGTGDEAKATFHWVVDKAGALYFSDYPTDNGLVKIVEEGSPWIRATE